MCVFILTLDLRDYIISVKGSGAAIAEQAGSQEIRRYSIGVTDVKQIPPLRLADRFSGIFADFRTGVVNSRMRSLHSARSIACLTDERACRMERAHERSA